MIANVLSLLAVLLFIFNSAICYLISSEPLVHWTCRLCLFSIIFALIFSLTLCKQNILSKTICLFGLFLSFFDCYDRIKRNVNFTDNTDYLMMLSATIACLFYMKQKFKKEKY